MIIWTKDAEREQLQKIESLIMATEPGSYIRTAFDGCIDMAKNNIENDLGDSFPVMLKDKEKTIADMIHKTQEAGGIIRQLEHERDTLTNQIGNLRETLENRNKLIDSHRAEIDNLREALSTMTECNDGNNEIITELEDQIKDLKARLYDFMMKGAN